MIVQACSNVCCWLTLSRAPGAEVGNGLSFGFEVAAGLTVAMGAALAGVRVTAVGSPGVRPGRGVGTGMAVPIGAGVRRGVGVSSSK